MIDALRGIAALMVAWYHLSHVMGFSPARSVLYRSGAYGWLGVQVFFIISGFVIPWSLDRRNYSIRAYPRFLLKRIVRLDPPYIVSVLTYIALAAYFAYVTNTHFKYSATQLLLHIGYLNVFFTPTTFVNPVYWTLAVEVQYYLLVGIAFPLIRKPKWCWLAVAPVFLLLSELILRDRYIFHFAAFFLLGIAAFHYRRGSLSMRWFLMSTIVFGVFAAQPMEEGRWLAIVCVAVAWMIAFVNDVPKIFAAFGAISYSLYLMHGPVGFSVAELLLNRGVAAWPALLLALAASVLAAAALYRWVELPSLRLSSRIKYPVRDREAKPTETLLAKSA